MYFILVARTLKIIGVNKRPLTFLGARFEEVFFGSGVAGL